jgi:nitroreductase
MKFGRPVEEIIRERYSCRTYRKQTIDAAALTALERHMADDIPAPFGSSIRFSLIAAEAGEGESLKKVGTYGMIKDAPAYIAGALREGSMCLEDYGYRMELIILAATDAGLGTCWLGGTFSRSNFAQRMSLLPEETMPAVAAVGHAADRKRMLDSLVRFGAGSDRRKPWGELFFEGEFDTALAPDAAGTYGPVLEMVRLAPSASNKQPWRIVREKEGGRFHFYLQRTKNYHERWSITGMSDLQRVDMGIALCHFEAAARGAGRTGSWTVSDPGLAVPDALCEYTATWQEA